MDVSSPLGQLYILYYSYVAGKHLHGASSTENIKENTSRHGLARWTKIFRVGQKFLTPLKIFILG